MAVSNLPLLNSTFYKRLKAHREAVHPFVKGLGKLHSICHLKKEKGKTKTCTVKQNKGVDLL